MSAASVRNVALTRLLSKLEDVHESGDGWRACCPAHKGKNPETLSISETPEGKILVHCFAGCETSKVVNAVGLEMYDLYPGNHQERRRADPTKRLPYVSIDSVVYESEAFCTLPAGPLKLWLDVRTMFKGDYNNGNLSITLATPGLRKRGWTSNDTLRRALRVLLDRGLLKCTRPGKAGPGKICSLYAFTDHVVVEDKHRYIMGGPASYDFLDWKASGTKRRSAERKSVGRNPDQHCTGIRTSIGPEPGSNRSNSALRTAPPLGRIPDNIVIRTGYPPTSNSAVRADNNRADQRSQSPRVWVASPRYRYLPPRHPRRWMFEAIRRMKPGGATDLTMMAAA